MFRPHSKTKSTFTSLAQFAPKLTKTKARKGRIIRKFNVILLSCLHEHKRELRILEMSWLSDLAGRAESILNKIDQNAANVLKSENDQLIEVKSNGDEKNAEISSIRRTESTNILKLSRTPKKIANKVSEMDIIKGEKSLLNVSSNEDTHQLDPSMSNASNSSRRSSWSSRTEGVTVIEYPMGVQTVTAAADADVAVDMTSSVNSNQSADGKRNELAAIKIVVAQLKMERDQFKADLDEMMRRASLDRSNEMIADLERTCDELMAEKEQISEKLEQTLAVNNACIKSISDLETTVAKLHQSEIDSNDKMNMAKAEREHAISELQQYRSRAQHTLQLKDQLIEELKSASRANTTPASTSSDQPPCRDDSEVQALQLERDQLQTEIQALRHQNETSQQYVSSLESRIYDIENRSKEREEFLNNALQHEKLKCIQHELHMQALAKEVEAAREEMARQQTNFSHRIHER